MTDLAQHRLTKPLRIAPMLINLTAVHSQFPIGAATIIPDFPVGIWIICSVVLVLFSFVVSFRVRVFVVVCVFVCG